MLRIISKLTIIAVTLFLISAQVSPQEASSSGLPTLYRNGKVIVPGTGETELEGNTETTNEEETATPDDDKTGIENPEASESDVIGADTTGSGDTAVLTEEPAETETEPESAAEDEPVVIGITGETTLPVTEEAAETGGSGGRFLLMGFAFVAALPALGLI